MTDIFVFDLEHNDTQLNHDLAGGGHLKFTVIYIPKCIIEKLKIKVEA